MDFLEAHYIQLYSPACTINSYNIESGGKRGYVNSNSKIVYQYDLKGNLIKPWKSTNEICDAFKNYRTTTITGSANGSTLSAYGFIWTYDGNDIKKRVSKINPDSRLYNQYKILQYNLEGIFIKEWDSVIQASKFLNLSYDSIINAMYRKQSSGNYIWVRKDKNDIQDILINRKNKLIEVAEKSSKYVYFIYKDQTWTEYLGSGIPSKILNISQAQLWRDIKSEHGYKIYKNGIVSNRVLETIPTKNIDPRKKSIIKLSKNGNIIEKFDTIKQAANTLNVSASHLAKSIKSNPEYGGYFWKYADQSTISDTDATITV